MNDRLDLYISLLSYSLRTNTLDQQKLQDLLISIYYFLNLTSQRIAFRNAHKLSKEDELTSLCPLCKTMQYPVFLPCGHGFCRKCLEISMLEHTAGTLVGITLCTTCNKEIPASLVYKVFGSTKKVGDIRKRSELLEEVSMFTCEICLVGLKVEEGITLDCDHRYCGSCLKGYMEQLIIENKVTDSEFHCPKCVKVINPFVVKAHCSEEISDKYLEFRVNLYQPSDDKNVFKKCPFCECPMEIPIEMKEVECHNCKKRYCPQCNGKHTGTHCPSKEVSIEIEGELGKNVRKCPKCGVLIVKDGGCNFLECPITDCKTFFCYICMKVLKKAEHYSHFFTNGPFGDTCNKVDGIKD